LLQIGNNPFDADWLINQPLQFYGNTISAILGQSWEKLTPANEAFNLLREQCLQDQISSSDDLRLILSEELLLRGKTQELAANLNQISSEQEINILVLWGWFYFITGNNEKAIASYTQAYKNLQKSTRKKKIYFDTTGGIFFILALIKEGSGQSLQ
jgi:hypothetical protein